MPHADRSFNTFAAATLADINRWSGDWIFVDIGFSHARRTSGIASGTNDPDEILFSDLPARIANILRSGSGPANLLIEAPLSVAFTVAGNPAPRSIERQGDLRRDWYSGSGAAVLLATIHLLRRLSAAAPARPLRLVEGFLSFKRRRTRLSHAADVARLREVAWSTGTAEGRIVAPGDLKRGPDDTLVSAFAVAGMDSGVPPVVYAGPPFASAPGART